MKQIASETEAKISAIPFEHPPILNAARPAKTFLRSKMIISQCVEWLYEVKTEKNILKNSPLNMSI